MFKKVLIHTRRTMKLVILITVVLLAIIAVVASFYKISYSVSLNGQELGYTDNKSKLQSQINEYMENGENQNTAFVQLDNLPKYKICLLKRNVNSNDDEIFNTIKSGGTTYYRYYAVLENQEEKVYVPEFTEAEEIVNKLKEKNSTNIDNITISEKYDTELKVMDNIDDAIETFNNSIKPWHKVNYEIYNKVKQALEEIKSNLDINLFISKEPYVKQLTNDKIINLTGQSGSGKSTYANNNFNSNEYEIIDTDEIFNEVRYEKSSGLNKKLGEYFREKYDTLPNLMNDFDLIYNEILEYCKKINKTTELKKVQNAI